MFGIAENRISLGKETMSPMAAELHYFRLDKKYWSICFERIKRTGIKIVSTPVPWNLHQDKNKEIDFVGYDDPHKDLTVFLELARELGFKIILRPGPNIGSEWPNGGIPEFVLTELRGLARSQSGDEVQLKGVAGVRGGYLSSYLSSPFLNSYRTYHKTFVEVTRNYIHPRGPVIMIELDNAPSFAGLLDPGAADYNAEMLTKYYLPFLMERFGGEIKKLAALYHSDAKAFESVTPPRIFSGATHKNLPQIFDWFRYKQGLLVQYLDTLQSMYEGLPVSPLFSRSVTFSSKALLPMYKIGESSPTKPIGCGVSYAHSHADVARHGRYLRGSGSFPWASSFPIGYATADPSLAEKIAPVGDGERRATLASAIAAGFKGFNLKMFVDHERWHGAPLKADGSVTPGFEFVRALGEAVEAMELSSAETEVKVAVVGNRLYQWFSHLPAPGEFEYVGRLVNETMPSFCRDLARLRVEYDIVESDQISSLTKYALVVIPSAEFMSASEQEAIVELTKHGVAVALVGAAPRLDEDMHPCATLANFFTLKTSAANAPEEITVKDHAFVSYVYSHVKTTDTKAKKIASADKNLVAVASTKRSGQLTFFGMDIASGFDHHKLLFLEEFLKSHKIESAVYCSDPMIDISLFANERKAIITLVAPPPGQLGDRVETVERDIFIRADLKKAGLKSPTIKIVDLFTVSEVHPPLKTTSAALAEGISLKMSYPDGKILVIEKRS